MTFKAQLFVSCIIDSLYPEIGEAVARILQRAGVELDFPAGQTCCGQPAFNAGMRQQAREMARYTILVFENAPGDIVIPSGSCTAMIRHGYQELFADDRDWLSRVAELSKRTYEFSEYLVDVLQVVDLGSQYEGRITYHPSCHLSRDLGIDRQPVTLLENVTGVEVLPLPKREECCGFGGLFSIEHPEISKAMLDRKLTNLEASGAPTLVSCDAGCVAHISGGLHRQERAHKAVHLAEILDNPND